ncbi:MAG: hypothetical protein ACXVBY_23135, partial [Isosphaeraceae bacterium]
MSHAKLKRFRLGRSLLGGVLTISGLVGIAVLAAPPATASSLIYQLDPGDRLSPGTVIASENGLYQLKMADNGNVLL